MIPRDGTAAAADSTTGGTSDHHHNAKLAKSASSTSASTHSAATSWSWSKDPRIVRMSRVSGGKDRHSKVCTVRGLRDRRVRLSVPTAIQLYDLQDRLGFNQPSKVVDWLLNAARNEIDELPPLQIPQTGFMSPNQMILPPNDQSEKQLGHNVMRNDDHEGDDSSRRFDLDQYQLNSNVPSLNFQVSNSFVKWDPSNLTLSHPPRTLTESSEDSGNFNLVPYAGSHHQVLVYQPGLINTSQSFFPSQISPTSMVFDSNFSSFGFPLDTNHSTNQPVISPFHFSRSTANLNYLPSSRNNGDQNERNEHNVP